MKSSPPRLNPKTDLIVSRYLRFPAFFFGCFLPRPARSHRLSVLFPLPRPARSCRLSVLFPLPRPARSCRLSVLFPLPRPARSCRLSALFPLHQTCPFAQTFRLISTAPDLPVRADFPPYFHCTRPARSRRLSALFPLPRPARLHRLSVLFPLPAVSSRQIFLIFVLTKNFRNAICSPT